MNSINDTSLQPQTDTPQALVKIVAPENETPFLADESGFPLEDKVLRRIINLARIQLQSKVDQKAPNARYGFVYLAYGGEYCKIGQSVSPHIRYRNLGIMMPFPMELWHFIECENAEYSERYWHMRFSDFHVRGEWFQLGEAEIQEFCKVNRVTWSDQHLMYMAHLAELTTQMADALESGLELTEQQEAVLRETMTDIRQKMIDQNLWLASHPPMSDEEYEAHVAAAMRPRKPISA